MSKKIRNLCFCVLLIIILSVVAVILTKMPENEVIVDTPTEEAEEVITLINKNPDEFVSLNIKNKWDEYKIVAVNGSYTIETLENYVLDNSFLNLASAVLTVEPSRLIEENAEDLSKYGLDNPSIICTAEFTNDEVYTIYIGDTYSSLSITYIMLEGDNNVYAMPYSTFSWFTLTGLDFLNHLLVEPLIMDSATGTYTPAGIFGAAIKSPLYENEMKFEHINNMDFSPNHVALNPLVMIEPVVTSLDYLGYITYILGKSSYDDTGNGYFGLYADAIVAIDPTEAELEEFGLLEPESSFTLLYANGIPYDQEVTIDDIKKMTLITGNTINEFRDMEVELTYVMHQNDNCVYLVNPNSLKWLEAEPDKLITSMPLIVPVVDLDYVEVTINGETNTLTYIRSEMESTDNSENIAYEVNQALLNGEEVNASEAKTYLQLLYVTSVSGINYVEPEGDPVITFTYHYHDNDKVDTLEIYEQPDRTTIISMNGESNFKGRAGYIEKLYSETQKLLNGEKIDTEW